MPADQPPDIQIFGLRIPAALKEKVRQSATTNRRSINSEIIVLLEKSLPAENEKAETAPTVSAS
ncbi:Arc family DNA-binding protein [Rhizobium ruizarguesonis]